MQKGMARALAMQKWPRSLPERVALLKLWILPLFVHVAKLIFPSNSVIDSLSSCLQFTKQHLIWTPRVLHWTSWLILQRSEGTIRPPPKKNFWQHSSLFIDDVTNPTL